MSETGHSFQQKITSGDLGIYVGGKFVVGEGTSLSLVNPATEKEIGQLTSASAAQVNDVVDVARRAFIETEWSTDKELRASTLRTMADLVAEHADAIAYLDSIEAGKVVTDMLDGDVPDVVANLRFFADLVGRDEGRFLDERSGWGWVRGIPVGVVGGVLPWNFPIAMLCWKVAPALAAGNALVLKPSEDSTLSALLFAELATQAGLPDGILNVVAGDGPGTGSALGLHPDVDMLTFTGSGEVGRMFLEYSARSNLKKVSLELGGRAAYIVDGEHTVHLDTVAQDAVGAAFGVSGQNCTASSRLVFVGSDEDFQRFRAAVQDAAAGITVGDPMSPGTGMGPVINKEAHQRIIEWIDEAAGSGATLWQSPQELPEVGYYIAPTILENVPVEAQLGTGEIFGPVTQIIRAATREDAVRLVNDEPYGLASTVWCEDIGQAKWWADQIRVGTLAVNGYSEGTVATPFGGLRQSGFWGRDNGPEALAGYQEQMTVWISG